VGVQSQLDFVVDVFDFGVVVKALGFKAKADHEGQRIAKVFEKEALDQLLAGEGPPGQIRQAGVDFSIS
jgi:hypothetical protein